MNQPIVRLRQSTERKIIPNGQAVIFAEGKIGALVRFPVLVDEGRGYVAKEFEKFVRPPGTRIIALKDKAIYLQKELRLENEGFDWRLPGGKVVDTFKEYKTYLDTPVPETMIIEAARKELYEEAWLQAEQYTIFAKKNCGATVEWDLYYVVAKGITESTKESAHAEGEEIADSRWVSVEEVVKMIKEGTISEGRTAATLLEFITKYNLI